MPLDPTCLLSVSVREEIVARTRLQHHYCHVDCKTGSAVTQVYDSCGSSAWLHLPFYYANLNEAFRIIEGETTPASSLGPHPTIHKAKQSSRRYSDHD